MAIPEKYNRTKFDSKACPKCKEYITPITDGSSNPMHGYKVFCPVCKAYIGWGGKTYFENLSSTAGE